MAPFPELLPTQKITTTAPPIIIANLHVDILPYWQNNSMVTSREARLIVEGKNF